MVWLRAALACRTWQIARLGLTKSRPCIVPSLALEAHISRLTASQTASAWSRRHFHGDGSGYYDVKVDNIRNIGIIAHVDAGKTTTTERMLFHSGVTKRLGNVDSGDTVTDFLPMERDRGITIQSAAITFQWPLPESCTADSPPKTINLIDTPGHQDFRFEVDRCMPVIDGAVCVMDGVKGVEAHTERVWQSAQQFRIPRIMYVNKLDRDGASFKRAVSEIASRLNAWPLVCQIPWWEKDSFVGVLDVINRTAMRWKASGGGKLVYNRESLEKLLSETNPALLEELERAHMALIDILCEHDEALLEGDIENIPPEVMKKTIRRLISDGSGTLVPVFAGSSLRNIGIDPLLDAVVDYLPSANERPAVDVMMDRARSTLEEVIENSVKPQPISGKKKGGSGPKASIAAIASVFKVASDFNKNDMGRGMLSFVRVYHGKLPSSVEVWNSNRRKSEKALNMVQISANKTQVIPHLSTGQIGALKGLQEAKTGDTLILLNGAGRKVGDNPLSTIEIRPADIPNPVAFMTMAPAVRNGMKALESALERLSREDPSLRYTFNDREEVFVLSGMGRLHLEVLLDRIKTVYGVDVIVYGIEVEYKECLLQPTPPHRCVFDQVVNSKTGKAACTVTLEPLEPSQELPAGAVRVDENNAVHVSIVEPPPDAPRVEGFEPDRVRQDLLSGASAGLRTGPRIRRPVHGCLVSVRYDPATDFFGANTPASHNVKAAYTGVKACLKEAHARGYVGVLEPVMSVSILCPETAAEGIQHDIASQRGGTVLEINDRNETIASAEGGIPLDEVYIPADPFHSVHSLRDPKKGQLRMLEIKSVIPFKEMLNYDAVLRSKTGGRHSIDMVLSNFQRMVGAREKAVG